MTDQLQLHDWLWASHEPISKRYEKSACALIAVKQTLEKNRPLAGRERLFLKLYEECLAADQLIFTKVWTDPTAYYWVRLAYQLLANCISGTPLDGLAKRFCENAGITSSTTALEYHLRDFGRFVLALHYHAGTDYEFEEAFPVQLPFAIPATQLSIGVTGRADILAIYKTGLTLRIDGEVVNVELKPGIYHDMPVKRCFVARNDDFELPLHPHAFNNLSGLTFTGPVLNTTPDFLEQNISLVEQTLEKIHRFAPQCFQQFKEMVHYIALKKMNTGDYTNISHSELPGTFIASVVNNPYMLAETFIHELHHYRLFCVEEKSPFFKVDTIHPLETLDFYSPWRNDLRPMHGIFHGVYVYIPVTEYWFAILNSNHTDRSLADFSMQRLVIMILQLRIGLFQLQQHANLTEYGEAILNDMYEFVAKLDREIDAVKNTLPDDRIMTKFFTEEGKLELHISKLTDRPLTATEYVKEHILLNAPEHQRQDIFHAMGWH